MVDVIFTTTGKDRAATDAFTALVQLTVWIAAEGIRRHRAYVASLRERALREALSEQRLQIARELHDIVAHAMSVVAVQAGVGSHITSHQTAERPARVLILTTFDLDEYVYAALRAGASGFLLKDTPPAELLAAIRIIAAGDALLAPSVTRKLIREFARQSPASPRPSLDVLTDREQDVLALVARGLANAEIAIELFISTATVKTHVSRLLTKLAARDRAQLVVVAYESGFVTPA